MNTRMLLCAVLALTMGAVSAQETDNNLYFGISAGTTDPDVGDEDTGYKFMLGYRAAPWIDVEAAFIDMGDFGPLEVVGFQAAGLAKYPLGDLEIFGKAGIFAWDTSGDDLAFFDDTGVDPLFGLGASYRFSEEFSVRAEFERFYEVDDVDIDMYSIGVTYDF